MPENNTKQVTTLLLPQATKIETQSSLNHFSIIKRSGVISKQATERCLLLPDHNFLVFFCLPFIFFQDKHSSQFQRKRTQIYKHHRHHQSINIHHRQSKRERKKEEQAKIWRNSFLNSKVSLKFYYLLSEKVFNAIIHVIYCTHCARSTFFKFSN